MIVVIIATTGRPNLIQSLLARLRGQTLVPEWIVLAPARPGDILEGTGAEVANCDCKVAVLPCVVGLPNQRNAGLDWCEKNTELFSSDKNAVVFFDDDFVPAPDWLEQSTRIFDRHSDIAGLTGTLLADGVKGPGLREEDAERLLSTAPKHGSGMSSPRGGCLYGCNMAIRASVARARRFDEMLPLYGWQEDFDYSRRVMQAGRVVQTEALVGVHLGVKGGRVSGLRFGYSQIANPYYLLTKGTMGPRKALRLVAGNLAANLARAPFPESHIDRWGRLHGNVMAFRDLLLGRLDPRRVVRL